MSPISKSIRAGLLSFVAVPAILVGCGFGGGPLSRGGPDKVAPALEVLALDFERTNFSSSSRVSGSLAQAQKALHISTATSGRFRNDAHGPIPTEVRVDVTELVTSGNTVRMSGKLAIRDLAFGTIMAELPNFSASGPIPVASRGAGPEGRLFRAVEDEVLAWLGTLECDTGSRVCGVPAPDAIAEVPEVPVTEEGDIELAALVGPRPTGLRKINSGGIDPDQVIAAAEPVEEVAPEAAEVFLGRTVVALGLLGRSGFWIQTPLVSTESVGFVVNPSNGQRITVTLIPKDGPEGGGSQMSLAALTELGASPTDLVNVEVYR